MSIHPAGRFVAAIAALVFTACAPPSRQPSLRDAIAAIKAFDNHAHPVRIVDAGEPPDEGWDELVWDAEPDVTPPVGLRSGNPIFLEAWRALYGYAHTDTSEAHLAELAAARTRIMADKGDGYPSWVLDQLGIETMVANRVAMGRGLDPKRFRWASFVDALLFPLSTEQIGGGNPEYRGFYRGMKQLLGVRLQQAGLPALPATLDEYVTTVVAFSIEQDGRAGAVAVKLEAAYLRALDVGEAPREAASAIYRRYASGGQPPPEEYKLLQDYLFRIIVREAGRRGLAVHVHTGLGSGSFYDIKGSNPSLLEPLLNDPSLRGTRVVLIHGGWPFAQEAGALLTKPNVYADFSAMTFLLTARTLSGVIRAWLELTPEKVLFATDGFPLSPQLGWEEVSWLSNRVAREALALAVEGMIDDGVITEARALELARMVLRENALALYGSR